MANLNKTFIEFNDEIKLSPNKKKQLKGSRDSIRIDIRKYFKDNRDKHSVSFKGQGSYLMNTTILPLSNEYDVDDGIYIFGKKDDRPTVQQAHDWIFNAVKDRTNAGATDKNTCVRVVYKKDYHVDLPIYYKTDKSNDQFTLDDETPLLAHKTKGWIPSDPYAFKKWFDDEAKEKPQLKRIVRYLKAWSDKRQNDNNTLKFPSGMIFTILACNHYCPDDRDDISLLKTLKAVQKEIDDRNNILFNTYRCYRPTVDTDEDLLKKYSAKTTKDNFLNALDSFIKSGDQAIELVSKKDACAKWQKHLGDRFPCSNLKDDEEESSARSFSQPDKLNFDNKSA